MAYVSDGRTIIDTNDIRRVQKLGDRSIRITYHPTTLSISASEELLIYTKWEHRDGPENVEVSDTVKRDEVFDAIANVLHARNTLPEEKKDERPITDNPIISKAIEIAGGMASTPAPSAPSWMPAEIPNRDRKPLTEEAVGGTSAAIPFQPSEKFQ